MLRARKSLSECPRSAIRSPDYSGGWIRIGPKFSTSRTGNWFNHRFKIPFQVIDWKTDKNYKDSILLIPTIVGYLVSGPLANFFCPKYQFVSEKPINGEISLVTNEHLSKLLKQFFMCEGKFLREGVDKKTLSKDEIYALQFFQNTYEILPHPNPRQSAVYNTETPQDWPDMNPKYIFQVKLNKKQCGGKLRKQLDSILHRFYNL